MSEACNEALVTTLAGQKCEESAGVVCMCVSLSQPAPVRQGNGKTQGWLAGSLSQGTLGQWETGSTLGSAQSLLVFSCPSKRYLMAHAEHPDVECGRKGPSSGFLSLAVKPDW